MAFMEWNRWGHEILWHDGAHVGFTAELFLFPKLNTGFYIAANSKNGGLSGNLKYALLNRYFKPENPETLKTPFEVLSDRDELVGQYVDSRRGYGNIAKLFVLLQPALSLSSNDDGTVSALDIQFAEQQPGLFAYLDRPDMKFFVVRDEQGAIDYISFDYGGAPRSYVRLKGLDNLLLHRLVLAMILLSFLITAIAWPIVRRRQKHPDTLALSRWSGLCASMNLLFTLALVARMATIDSMLIRAAQAPELMAILFLPFLSMAIWLALALKIAKHWKRCDAGLKLKGLWLSHFILTLVFFGELYYWNILGISFLS